jgi:hypothetical protein
MNEYLKHEHGSLLLFFVADRAVTSTRTPFPLLRITGSVCHFVRVFHENSLFLKPPLLCLKDPKKKKGWRALRLIDER